MTEQRLKEIAARLAAGQRVTDLSVIPELIAEVRRLKSDWTKLRLDETLKENERLRFEVERLNNPPSTKYKLLKENDKLRAALKGLLEDSQHAEHNCGEDAEQCPVIAARKALGEKE